MTNKQALREAAESTIGILENIAGFEPSDIDGDTVELRFETDGGLDTGCDVSIVDQCQKAADVVRALRDELEVKDKAWTAQDNHINQQADRIESLEKKNGELGRALGAAQKRIAELEAKEVVLPQRISMEGGSYCTAHARYDEDGDFYYRDEVIESLVAAGIRINGEG